jgi:DNA repair protein RadC
MQCSQSMPSGQVSPFNYADMNPLAEDEIIQQAKSILEKRFARQCVLTKSPVVKDFFMARLAQLEYEVFCVAFLDNRHGLSVCENMFRGTINHSAVYPREVVKRALDLNAAAVILAHNHPSGYSKPSQSDISMTHLLENTLKLFDIRILDHVVVGATKVISFAELGLLSISTLAES